MARQAGVKVCIMYTYLTYLTYRTSLTHLTPSDLSTYAHTHTCT